MLQSFNLFWATWTPPQSRDMAFVKWVTFMWEVAFSWGLWTDMEGRDEESGPSLARRTGNQGGGIKWTRSLEEKWGLGVIRGWRIGREADWLCKQHESRLKSEVETETKENVMKLRTQDWDRDKLEGGRRGRSYGEWAEESVPTRLPAPLEPLEIPAHVPIPFLWTAVKLIGKAPYHPLLLVPREDDYLLLLLLVLQRFLGEGNPKSSDSSNELRGIWMPHDGIYFSSLLFLKKLGNYIHVTLLCCRSGTQSLGGVQCACVTWI